MGKHATEGPCSSVPPCIAPHATEGPCSSVPPCIAPHAVPVRAMLACHRHVSHVPLPPCSPRCRPCACGTGLEHVALATYPSPFKLVTPPSPPRLAGEVYRHHEQEVYCHHEQALPRSVPAALCPRSPIGPSHTGLGASNHGPNHSWHQYLPHSAHSQLGSANSPRLPLGSFGNSSHSQSDWRSFLR